MENQPTVISLVTDALVFGVEHSFLQHSEDDDSSDPELDPKQIPPIAGTPEKPESPEEHIYNAHDHEELWWTEEREKCSALYLIPSQLYTKDHRQI